MDSDGSGDEILFEEEALRYVVAPPTYVPFPGPKNPKNADDGTAWFQEPNVGPTDPAWLQFNRWILGNELVAPIKQQGESQADFQRRIDFFNFLTELANRIREYNAALYSIRRLHHWENRPFSNDDSAQIGDPYPHNTYDKKDAAFKKLPDLSSLKERRQFAKVWVPPAEKRWSDAVLSLNAILSGDDAATQGYDNTEADMIEVNGYIASMRIISQQDPLIKEVVGSSSSHISISSAFIPP